MRSAATRWRSTRRAARAHAARALRVTDDHLLTSIVFSTTTMSLYCLILNHKLKDVSMKLCKTGDLYL